MPKMNRYRLTNIQLDEGKKLISDSIWEMNGKDALFILENGGGKTSIIQLITQTILPNSTLSKRELKNTVNKGTTGHIMTEWKLDGDNLPYEYLCLGFTFMNGESSKENLAYFTYCFAYNKTDSVQIGTLPVQQNGKVTRFAEYKKHLRQNEIRIFDVNREYKKELKRYNILSEEWEMIQKINGDEGGVDKFFKNATSTKDLLVKLLIPEVEKTIFDTVEKKKEIQNYFKEYSKNLLRIPDMKRDLQDFFVIKDRAEVVVSSVSTYEAKKMLFLQTQKEVIILKKSVETEIKQKTEQMGHLSEEQENIESEMKEIKWKLESHKVHLLEAQLNEIKRKMKETETSLERKEGALEKCKALLKKWEATKEYEEYLKIEQDVINLKAEIAALSASDAELEVERNESKRLLNEAWKYLLEVEEARLSLQQSEVREMEEQIAKQKAEHKRLQNEKETAGANYQKAVHIQESHQKEKQLIEKDVHIDAGDRPHDFLDTFGKEQEESTFIIKEKESENTKLIESIKEKRKWLTQSALIEQEKKAKVNQLKEKRKQYDEVVKMISGYLEYDGKMVTNLQDESSEILSDYMRGMENAERTVDEYKQVLHDILQKMNLLDSYDFFVPNETLLDIQAHLEEKGVVVMLGSEWLSELSNEDLKKEYLQSFPLLPYSLLVEENQLSDVKKKMAPLQETIFNTPILFYVKNQLKTGQTNTYRTGEFSRVEGGLWLYQQLDIGWFDSKENFEESLKKLSDDKAQTYEQIDFAKKEYEQKKMVAESIQSFKENYSICFPEENENEQKELEEEINGINEEMERENQKILEMENEININQLSIHEQGRKYEERKGLIKKIQYYVETFPNPEEITRAVEDRRVLHEQIKTKIFLCEDEQVVLEKKLNEGNKRTYVIELQITQFQNDKERHQLDDNVEPNDLYTSVEKVEFEARYLAAQKEYEKKEQVKILKESNLFDKNAQMKKSETAIDDIGSSLEEMKSSYQKQLGLNELIKEEKVNHAKLNQQVNSLKVMVGTEQGLKEGKEKEIATQIEAIEDAFKHGIYEYDPEDHEREHQTFKKNKERLFSRGKEIKQEVEALRARKNDMEYSLRLFSSIGQLPPYKTEHELLTEGFILNASISYEEHVDKQVKLFKKYQTERKNSEGNVLVAFDTYIDKINGSKNEKVERFSHGLSKLRESEKLFDSEYIFETFSRIFDTIDAYEQDLNRKIEECEKDKEKLVELCYQRVDLIHKNIMEIPKYSRIELFGHEIQLIKIRWDRNIEDEAKSNVHHHVDILLKNMQKMKNENNTEKEMNEYMNSQLENVVILEKIAPIHKCHVTIYKPRKQSLMSASSDNWKLWDEVSDWSGGEEFSSYMSMFMVLVSYLRKKVNAKDDSWKMIIADNPFGKASSEHVVAPIMELSRKSKIQMLCLTAHNIGEIRSHFECVMSNRYYSVAGIELLQTQVELGSFAYELD
ncbi:hypothetical protein ACFVR2_07465 [Gottfriedia sp. NPDC057991]|uniref:hypothetical protein n=1 Tax=Gottfriedia sp. NPDC057991 TaxID=3346298 RepID=UPI0036DAC92F